ncbi:MAG: hypothetical protein IJ359_08350 [Erysipelotrichaceae bacterium]|nr:hypothetical protein [Erysipelotrichaceae bacterium]
MKRFVLDILVILMIVSIVSVLSSNNEQYVSLDEELEKFESQIENGYMYQPNKDVYLLQIEENRAGKLGNALSIFVVSIIQEGVGIVKKIMDVF